MERQIRQSNPGTGKGNTDGGVPEALIARARRAYELGRGRLALRTALLGVPALVAALALGRSPLVVGVAAAIFLPLLAVLSWRGRDAGRAILPGLIAGLAPLLLPLSVRTIGHAWASSVCMSLCMPACYAGGAIAGALLAWRVRQAEGSSEFLLAAVAIAGLAGSLGCTVMGLSGLLGMAGGALVGAVPLALVAPARH